MRFLSENFFRDPASSSSTNLLALQSKSLTHIHEIEFLELMFNFMELKRLRVLINVHLFTIAFILDIY